MYEVIHVSSQLAEERDEVVVLIKYVEMRDDKEKAYCRLPLVVFQDRNELVRQAKYELEHTMLVLQQTTVHLISRDKEYAVVNY
jgi:hypothetical protein